MIDLSFYKGKRVLVTGHTGFKGSWLSQILINAGAELTGYSLMPLTNPNLYELIHLEKRMNSIIGDIRDFENLKNVFEETKPEIVFHLAAQPLVLESYRAPRITYETNVMGTVNVLECARIYDNVVSFLNITTDKVYKNNEWEWGYRENESLDGYDPYSNSKSCSELVTHSYWSSFFQDGKMSISTARAGNVIGGGDFAEDRIIPDCIRASMNGEKIVVRNPNSTRPYQHVLEPLMAYLMIAQKQYEDRSFAGWYNVGPDEMDCVTTGELVDLFCQLWGDVAWHSTNMGGKHEANFLKLDCSKIKKKFGWSPHWHIYDAVEKSCEWTKMWLEKKDLTEIMNRQIDQYMEGR